MGAHTGKYIAYYRVSTQRQGRSGLGLDAQRQAVREHLNGGNWQLIEEITEVESGKRADRPKLAEALRLCRLRGATLIIAKLDRLARNVAFVSALMDAGVEFEAVDFPQANRLTIHIMAAVAEHEAKAISQRTKAALASATIGTAAGLTLCISEGSISMWIMRARGANSLTFPVTRSSKRSPTPMTRSAMPIAWLTCAGPCIPGIPMARGCVSGKALRPSSVVMTGILAFSAKANNSSKAFDRMTP